MCNLIIFDSVTDGMLHVNFDKNGFVIGDDWDALNSDDWTRHSFFYANLHFEYHSIPDGNVVLNIAYTQRQISRISHLKHRLLIRDGETLCVNHFYDHSDFHIYSDDWRPPYFERVFSFSVKHEEN